MNKQTPFKIPFGIRFKVNQYTSSEVYWFIQAVEHDQPFEGDLNDRYLAFLNTFIEGEIKPSTMVDYDVLKEFYHDVENRSSIDYQEGNYESWEDQYKGGKYFHQKALKLKEQLLKI